MPPRHPEPPTQSSCTTHLVIMNASPRHPEPPTQSSCTTHYVILNFFQDLVSATLDSGSSPDDVGENEHASRHHDGMRFRIFIHREANA
jgi:hypothetical protein